MQELFYYLGSGLFLGIVAGISPGPLLPLVVTETLKYGQKEGMKLALAPLITDLPIILAAYFLIRNFAENNLLLGIISLLGALFLLLLAYENIRYKPSVKNKPIQKPRSFQRGIVVNLLNPHPYLFWILVGAPILVNASRVSSFAIVLFLAGFYMMLVGSKIVFALLTGKMKNILQQKAFVLSIRSLGIVLIVFSVLLFKEAVHYIL
ncbi:MAG: LysE family transporter [Bacteroidales bacterium]|jgi:threonine/homoserine/homoserine lactone efflux protein|nr:LysE family transporter [Bacteroidales bacterium]